MYNVTIKQVPSRYSSEPRCIWVNDIKTKKQVAEIKREYTGMLYYFMQIENTTTGMYETFTKTMAEKWRKV